MNEKHTVRNYKMETNIYHFIAAALLTAYCLLPAVASAQDGANDSTFNPTDIGFGDG